jgi:hypothetical protein
MTPCCTSPRFVAGRCLHCWRTDTDWREGRLQPVDGGRVVYERADGTRWQWAKDGDTWVQREDRA